MDDIILKSDLDFRYRLLARLQQDCEYYLGAEARFDGHLWSGNPEQQIKDMKELYDSFPDADKPEWITLQQIEIYQNRMICAGEITLYIKYQDPINVNGFVVETDTIAFGSYEEFNNYVNGEAAYDVLDNSVTKRDNEILLYAENENGDVVWGAKDLEGRYSESMTYGGFDYQVIDKWQDDIGTYVVGQLEADDGTWYAAKVTDTTEQYHGEYEYEFGNDKPTRSEVEDKHLNHISEIDIDRHEAEFGADGYRNFPHLNDTKPQEESQEHIRHRGR